MLCLVCVISVSAQKVSYAYDYNGNRILRELTIGSNKSVAINEDLEENPLIDSIDGLEIKIYPNPTHGVLRVGFPELNDELFTITVYSINGNIVYHISEVSSLNTIDLTGCVNGIYVMTLAKGNEKRSWKIIKK